jgi:hypothetical protein
MKSFKIYLKENDYIYESSLLCEEISSSDDKGKLHELLLGYHLSHHGDDNSVKSFPKHFRNELTQKTPEQTHDDIKARISPEDYSEAHKRAKEAADATRSHLKAHHGLDPEHIKNVSWTSNKSDHEKLTGKKDANSDADLMITTDHPEHGKQYHGVSVKVGSNAPNLRNPGLSQLNTLTHANPEVTKGIIDKHNKATHEAGYDSLNTQDDNHKQYKSDKVSSDSEAKGRATNAEKSKLDTVKGLAKHYTNAINELHPDHVKHILRTLVAPPTVHPHFRLHTKTPLPNKAGDTVSHTENHQENLEKSLAGHQYGYHAEQKGQRVIIHAKNPDGTLKRVAEIGMKGGSGPLKGFNGTVKSKI